MATESRLQTKIIEELKRLGFWVAVLSPNTGIPDGHPDVIGLKDGLYVALEVKASQNASKQPLQEYTINLLANGGYARFVWPENWPEVNQEIIALLK